MPLSGSQEALVLFKRLRPRQRCLALTGSSVSQICASSEWMSIASCQAFLKQGLGKPPKPTRNKIPKLRPNLLPCRRMGEPIKAKQECKQPALNFCLQRCKQAPPPPSRDARRSQNLYQENGAPSCALRGRICQIALGARTQEIPVKATGSAQG